MNIWGDREGGKQGRVPCFGAALLAAVHCTTPHCVCPTALQLWAEGCGKSCNALPHRLEAVGSGTLATHCLTALGQWAVQLLQCTAPLPWGSGQWNSSVGSGAPAPFATHCSSAWGQWAVQPLQCTASLPGGSGQCPLQYIASLPRGRQLSTVAMPVRVFSMAVAIWCR